MENFLKGYTKCVLVSSGNYTHVEIRRHYHSKYTLITLAPKSYLRSLVVRAVHRHHTSVDSIPAGGPVVDEFFSTVPG